MKSATAGTLRSPRSLSTAAEGCARAVWALSSLGGPRRKRGRAASLWSATPPYTYRGGDATTDDADGDTVSLSYLWEVDGIPVAETSETSDGATWFDRDQVVEVTVTLVIVKMAMAIDIHSLIPLPLRSAGKPVTVSVVPVLLLKPFPDC